MSMNANFRLIRAGLNEANKNKLESAVSESKLKEKCEKAINEANKNKLESAVSEDKLKEKYEGKGVEKGSNQEPDFGKSEELANIEKLVDEYFRGKINNLVLTGDKHCKPTAEELAKINSMAAQIKYQVNKPLNLD